MSASSVTDPDEGTASSRADGCMHRLKPNKQKAKHLCKEWFKEPLNVAFFVWLCAVFICAIAFFLSLSGMLDNMLHKNKSLIDLSFEVPNQTLNALFTLLCIYVHPTRFYHLLLLCRWRPDDVIILRKVYCKDGTYKPKEWSNMMIVVVLLHVNCFAQYALCGLNMGLRKPDRPVPILVLFLVASVAAPITAVIIMNHGSLGRDHNHIEDEEAPIIVRRMSFVSKNEQKIIEENPKWTGGLMDICDDRSAATLSFFCCFYAFGWNMERLGLGNMYVHITTFLLICTSPLVLFYFASVRIENEVFSKGLEVVGLLLSFLGLLHGGIWRIKMRKEYNLPPYNNNRSSLADCAKWLFCCWCSLAQEVRTGSYYDIMEREVVVIPPRKDDGNGNINGFGVETSSSMQCGTKVDSLDKMQDKAMAAPVLPVIRRGGGGGGEVNNNCVPKLHQTIDNV